jgi:uncharacterized protein (DUF488 family)
MIKDVASHTRNGQGTVFTIGHSTRLLSEFMHLLQDNQIELLVDVRAVPRSRTNPQFNIDTLPATLAAVEIGYVHLSALGGLRHRCKTATTSPNALWQNTSFRNYADYAGTEAFRVGLEELEVLASTKRCAIMCAETLWWRCHRRIIADYLLTHGIPVAHIMGPGKIVAAKVTPGAEKLPDGRLVYPATTQN